MGMRNALKQRQWWRSAGLVTSIMAGLSGVGGLGCRTAEYHGAIPSARSLTESPHEIRDFYLGMNFKWSLDRPDGYHRTSSAPTAVASAPSPSQTQTSIAPDDGDHGD